MRTTNKLFILCFFIGIFMAIVVKIVSFLNLKMPHPCPKLTKIFPVIKEIDKMLTLSANISWYKVKDKITGKEYLFHISWDYKNKKDILEIMDYKKRDKWIEITREEYFERFGQPTDYEGFEENPFGNESK